MENKKERLKKMQTQGVKGLKLPRINTAYTPENHEFLTTVSRLKGVTITNFINQIIEEYRTRPENAELLKDAQAVLKKHEGK